MRERRKRLNRIKMTRLIADVVFVAVVFVVVLYARNSKKQDSLPSLNSICYHVPFPSQVRYNSNIAKSKGEKLRQRKGSKRIFCPERNLFVVIEPQCHAISFLLIGCGIVPLGMTGCSVFSPIRLSFSSK